MAREDVEDEPRPVEHADVARPALLEVTRLSRRQLVVEHDEGDPFAARILPDRLDRSLADPRRRIRSGALFHIAPDGPSARGLDETLELVQVLLRERPGRGAIRNADQEDLLAARLRHREVFNHQ